MRKFKADGSLFHMQAIPTQVSSALIMYYDGNSLDDIRDWLKQEYDYYPSKNLIYYWIDKYTNSAKESLKEFKPKNIGKEFEADETVIQIGGKNVWVFDIIDTKTRYLLASRIALSRTAHDAQMLVEEASKVAGHKPNKIITDKLGVYPEGIEQALGSDTEHVQSSPFSHDDSTAKIERYHGTLKERYKVMRGLKDVGSAIAFIEGFMLHYNFFKSHDALDGKTPAEVAGVEYPYKNWSDIVNIPISKKAEIQSHKTPHIKYPKLKIKLPETHVGRPHKYHKRKPDSGSSNILSGVRL
jgi:transposase-like protein